MSARTASWQSRIDGKNKQKTCTDFVFPGQTKSYFKPCILYYRRYYFVFIYYKIIFTITFYYYYCAVVVVPSDRRRWDFCHCELRNGACIILYCFIQKF